MAKIVKTGKRYKVVNSINGVTVKGGSGLTRAQAMAKMRDVVIDNCGKMGQRCATKRRR